MSDDEVGVSNRRSRRAKAKAIDYAKEQEFSDEDLFEDVDKPAITSTAAVPKRRRTKGNRKSKGGNQDQDDYHAGAVDRYNGEDAEDYRPPKPIYTEKGYDPTLLPIRERFTFLPEFELDGSPKIEGIVGRRPVDENENKNTDDENSSDDNDGSSKENDIEASDVHQKKSRRGNDGGQKKIKTNIEKEESHSNFIDYEYLIKYKNKSHLHLEWKTGADLESMSKTTKTLYRRYLKKIAQGQDDELEDPNFDPSFVVAQKVLAEEEHILDLELSDKELLQWEKQREREMANDDDLSEEDDDKKEDESKEISDGIGINDDSKDERIESVSEEKKGECII